MGCFSSKSDVQPFAPEPPQPSYMMQAPTGQQPMMLQAHALEQPFALAEQLQGSPFMRSLSPGGLPWCQYVATAAIEVDYHTGFLAGPWAECVCWAVRFEHTHDWRSMPEYAYPGEGPAGEVLASLEKVLGGPHNMHAQETLQASSRLEEAMHYAAEAGQPMPIIDSSAALPAPAIVQPVPCQPVPWEQPFPAQPTHAWGEPAVGFGSQQHSCAAEPHGGVGPTLLGARQNQGMSTGGKVALAAAGGVAAGVAGYAVASHMDEVGDALGGAVEGVGHFAGEAFDSVENFVDDMF